jgi:hypothetical protein
MRRLTVAVSADVMQVPATMDVVARRVVLAVLGILGISQICAGCELFEAAQIQVIELPNVDLALALPVESKPARPAESVEDPAWRPRVLDLPDTCDRITARETPEGPVFGKRLPEWFADDDARWREQRRLRALVRLIGDEMGMDPLASEMLWRGAIREGSGNPGSVHMLSVDQAANVRSAYGGVKRATEWTEAPVMVFDAKRAEKSIGSINGWAVGRGTYGMNTSLFMHRWSTEAPPWVLCDPIVATVTAIYSMRAGLAKCSQKTLREAHWRLFAATCSIDDPERSQKFDRLARGNVRGLTLEPFDPATPAELGDRWPEESTDREALYLLLRGRAVDAGLVAR